jgi:hypothetical protein
VLAATPFLPTRTVSFAGAHGGTTPVVTVFSADFVPPPHPALAAARMTPVAITST